MPARGQAPAGCPWPCLPPPAIEPRAGWRQTVRTQRVRLRRALTPTLRRELETDLPDLYADARDLAAGALTDHGEAEAAAALPTTCPYDLDAITGNWLSG